MHEDVGGGMQKDPKLIGGETMKKRSLPEELQHSTIHTIVVPGVGHMMMVDDPLLFNKTLASALQ